MVWVVLTIPLIANHGLWGLCYHDVSFDGIMNDMVKLHLRHHVGGLCMHKALLFWLISFQQCQLRQLTGSVLPASLFPVRARLQRYQEWFGNAPLRMLLWSRHNNVRSTYRQDQGATTLRDCKSADQVSQDRALPWNRH